MRKRGIWALLPLLVFVILYFSVSLYFNDFYKVPVLVLFIFALLLALIQYPKVSIHEKIKAFGKGAGDENILLMIVIFLLAGGFGALSNEIGSITSTIHFALSYIDSSWIITGLFVVSCFISISLGTSVGTIAAVAPIAVGLESTFEGSMALGLAAVVGGAMFGDNLSFISDTTIAATRTQGVKMKDKFFVNFRLVTPAAILTGVIYWFLGNQLHTPSVDLSQLDFELLKILPYITVLVLAMMGIHVVWVLAIGLVMAMTIGLTTQTISFFQGVEAINSGFTAMFELSVLCLIIGGVVGIIKYNGGIDYLLDVIGKRIKNPKTAELGIFCLTAAVNATLANNTITILIVGPLAKEVADENEVNPKRSASILDTTSCFIQGILPYGAQILAALAAASSLISPVDILKYLYYPLLTGVATLLFIAFRPRKKQVRMKPQN